MFADLRRPKGRYVLGMEDCDSWRQMRTLVSGLEKVLGFGTLLSVNSLLYCVLYLPFLCLRGGPDAVRLTLMFLGTAALYHTANEGRLYHDLKEQDFIKLSAFYNILTVCNSLLRVLGKRLLLNLHGTSGALFWQNYGAAVVYVGLHAGVMYCQLVVVQVALHSSLATSAMLFLTTFITEIKAMVFKKTDRRLLFNMLCQDAAERLELALYLLTLTLKAALRDLESSAELTVLSLYLLAFTLFVDWLKYYFVLYLNSIRSSIFETDFYVKLQKLNLKSAFQGYYIDYWSETRCEPLLDPYSSLSLSFRFPSLPLACVVTAT